MYKNPLPVLTRHCGIKIPDVRFHLPKTMPTERVHGVMQKPRIDYRLWGRLRDMTLTEWGLHDEWSVRKQLWECYFPDSKPHIMHVLVYRCQKDVCEISRASGIWDIPRGNRRFADCKAGTKLSIAQIAEDLERPRILKGHLQAVSRYASELQAAMASPKTWDGVDPRHMEIYRALRDPKRIKPYGSLQD